MIDITNKTHKPTMAEIEEFIENPLFSAICLHMATTYKALVSTEFSGEKAFLGWNMCFRKAGKTLLRLYPRKNYFIVLVVIGRKEKDRVEQLLPQMSSSMRDIYQNTKELMGQRWLMLDLYEDNPLYADILRLIDIRRTSV